MEYGAATKEQPVDQRYYQVATPGSLAERLTAYARDGIYRDFLRHARPSANSTIIDVGVSDVTGEAANVLERKYPHLNQVTAVMAQEFRRPSHTSPIAR